MSEPQHEPLKTGFVVANSSRSIEDLPVKLIFPDANIANLGNNEYYITTGGAETDPLSLHLLDIPTYGLSNFTNDLGNYGGWITDISGQDLSTADNTTSAFITAGGVPNQGWTDNGDGTLSPTAGASERILLGGATDDTSSILQAKGYSKFIGNVGLVSDGTIANNIMYFGRSSTDTSVYQGMEWDTDGGSQWFFGQRELTIDQDQNFVIYNFGLGEVFKIGLTTGNVMIGTDPVDDAVSKLQITHVADDGVIGSHIDLANSDYANVNGAGSHLYMTNSNTYGQNVLNSYVGGNMVAKWRTDYLGNISWVAGAPIFNNVVNYGYHAFYTGGDYADGGTVRLFIDGVTGSVLVGNVTDDGSGALFQVVGNAHFSTGIIDASTYPSIDSDARILYASDGITPMFNWYSASGEMAIGANASAPNTACLAVGAYSVAGVTSVSDGATALGYGATATGMNALAVGKNSTVSADYASTIGNFVGPQDNGIPNSMILGGYTYGNEVWLRLGLGGIYDLSMYSSINPDTRILYANDGSTPIFNWTDATTLCIGGGSTVSGTGSTALGIYATVAGQDSLALGNSAHVSVNFGTTIGNFGGATPPEAVAYEIMLGGYNGATDDALMRLSSGVVSFPTLAGTGFLTTDGSGNVGVDVTTYAVPGDITIETAETNSSISPVTDGTYTVGAPLTPVTGDPGTITVVSGIITAIQEAT